MTDLLQAAGIALVVCGLTLLYGPWALVACGAVIVALCEVRP